MFFPKALFLEAAAMTSTELGELVQKMKAALEARPKHVLEDVAKRTLEDRASYFGSEMGHFLTSETGRMMLDFLKAYRRRISVVDCGTSIWLDGEGRFYKGLDDTREPKCISAQEAVREFLRIEREDPMVFLVDMIITFVGQEQ